MIETPSLQSVLLILDKPQGPTSHDAVARVRRALGTRAVGHAGTLDPMASGVLLLLVGECTKLSRFLAIESKSYRAVVRFGATTDTLDAEGQIVQEGALPEAVRRELTVLHEGGRPGESITAALAAEASRSLQKPPAFSAIKQGGTKAYQRARRGESVDLPDRQIHVESIAAIGACGLDLELELSVSKGYYVRSLARDLGHALGAPAHLVALRRTRIGPYSLKDAAPLDVPARYVEAARSLTEVVRAAMACATLTEAGVRRARFGQAMADDDFETKPSDGVTGWLDAAGHLVAVGDRSAGRPTLLRAFSPPSVVC